MGTGKRGTRQEVVNALAAKASGEMTERAQQGVPLRHGDEERLSKDIPCSELIARGAPCIGTEKHASGDC